MVSNRAPKCKYTQAKDSSLVQSKPSLTVQGTAWTGLLRRTQLALDAASSFSPHCDPVLAELNLTAGNSTGTNTGSLRLSKLQRTTEETTFACTEWVTKKDERQRLLVLSPGVRWINSPQSRPQIQTSAPCSSEAANTSLHRSGQCTPVWPLSAT